MPARSEQQQKLFGLALSVKRGDTPRSEASPEVLKIVDTMSEKDIEDFAGTKHSGIPKKVEQTIREKIREMVRQNLVSEMKYSNQTGIKSSIIREPQFSDLLDPKEMKWVRGNDVKIYKDRFSFIFTDGRKEMVFNLKKPYSVVKPLGNARSEIKKVYQQNESVVNEASKDVWYIQKWDEDGDATTVKRYTTFNKKQMQSDFDRVVKSLGDDEEAHFMKDSKRYVGEYILSVVNQNGKLKREITKGSRTVYTPYKMNSDNISESVVNEEFKSKDSTFEKVWSIFDKKDYFGVKEIAKTQIGNFERALQKNDKGAQEILDKFNGDMDKAKDYIFQVITDREKAKAFENYKALKGAVDSIQKGKPEQGAVGYVKRIIHNNSQKYSIALYNALRNKKFNNWKDIHADVDSLIGESVVSEEIKKGSVIIPYAMDKYGEFIVDKVFKNKKGETSYTGKFKKSGEKREFILHSKDRVVKESVNEAVSKTFKVPTQKGNLHIEVEEDPAGVFVDVIFNRVDLTTTDIQFPTGQVNIKQRQKRVKLKESVNEAGLPGEAVGYIQKPNGKKQLVKVFDTYRGGLMWQKKTGLKLLNQSGIERVGVMNKKEWDKNHARYAESVVSEAITKGQLMSFNKLVDSGENVVVYGNNGKRYIYQHSGDYKSVAVTDDTRSNPERTYQVLPINKIKKITVESVINEREKPKEITKREWDKTHKDFKGMVDGKPYMVYLDKKTQATVYGPVTIKEGVVSEGRAFINAARKAKEEGKTEFEFNGKTYPVTLKEGMINEMSDAEFVADQLSNPVADGTMDRREFISFVSKETNVDKNTLGKVYDAYFKLGGRDRVKLDRLSNALKFLSKFGIK